MLHDRYGNELRLGDFVITRRGQNLVVGQLYREPAAGKMLGVQERRESGYVKVPCLYRQWSVIKLQEDLTHLYR